MDRQGETDTTIRSHNFWTRGSVSRRLTPISVDMRRCIRSVLTNNVDPFMRKLRFHLRIVNGTGWAVVTPFARRTHVSTAIRSSWIMMNVNRRAAPFQFVYQSIRALNKCQLIVHVLLCVAIPAFQTLFNVISGQVTIQLLIRTSQYLKL